MKSIVDSLMDDEKKEILQARTAIRMLLSLDDHDRQLFAKDPDNDIIQAHALINRLKYIIEGVSVFAGEKATLE